LSIEVNRLAYIDALRGYAILAVMVVHVAQYVPALEWPLDVWAVEGARGVQLFFLASALTLMLSWHARADGVAAFYIRRVFRIVPMFWLAIPLYLALYGLGPHGSAPQGISWPHIVATAAFLHGFHPETISSIVPGGSTIAVEMTFYAVFPLLAASLRSWQSSALALCLAICLAGLLYPATIEVFHHLAPRADNDLLKAFSFSWFPTQLPAFLVGILVFHLLREFRGMLARGALRAGLAIALAVPIVMPLITGSMKILFVVYTLDFGLLAFCLAQGAGHVLVNACIRYLGTISYSAYFWHFAALWALGPLGLDQFCRDSAIKWPYFVALLAGVIAVTVVLSSITYRVIETPMIRVGRKLAAMAAGKPSVVRPSYRPAE
jgi:exopolysaccharide production protein ExoZ